VFTPSIVLSADDTVYLVEDDFGAKLGRVYRETDSAQCDGETTLQNLSTGQYNNPVRVIAFNTRDGWSRDVSYEFATELQRRADIDGVELTGTLAEFVQFYKTGLRKAQQKQRSRRDVSSSGEGVVRTCWRSERN
jgi:hypothetical protein